MGSRRSTTLLLDAQIGPESTSWITILMASPSRDVCRRGASRSSSAGAWYVVGFKRGAGIAPLFCNAAMSGLRELKRHLAKHFSTPNSTTTHNCDPLRLVLGSSATVNTGLPTSEHGDPSLVGESSCGGTRNEDRLGADPEFVPAAAAD